MILKASVRAAYISVCFWMKICCSMDNSKSKCFPGEYDVATYLQFGLLNLLLIIMHFTSLFLVILVTLIFFWNMLYWHNKNSALKLFIQDFQSTLFTSSWLLIILFSDLNRILCLKVLLELPHVAYINYEVWKTVFSSELPNCNKHSATVHLGSASLVHPISAWSVLSAFRPSYAMSVER